LPDIAEAALDRPVVSKRNSVPKNFWQSLLAVLIGNAIYFLSMSHLPRLAQHGSFSIDLGLVVDFWICLVIFGLLELVKRRRKRGQRPYPK
jgi:hypothetical protein